MILNKPSSSYRLPVVIILVVIAALAGGLYYSDHKSSKQPANSSNAKAENNRLVIKDFGIAITLPKDLVGTMAETAERKSSGKFTPPPTVNLILNKYSYTVSGCLGQKYDFRTPYASVSKISGKAPANDKQLLKQFDGFYIERIGSALSLTCNEQSTQATLDELNKTYDQALKSAFSDAQIIK